MAFFKCKMCGGELEVTEGITVCECEYCGTKQTLPRLDTERKINLYDRANHFRRNDDFDKAMSIYEQVLNEDSADAEAYWGVVLCRYGIEYVEDPSTHKRIPTVNRAQYTSIYADEDYKSAIQYASLEQKAIYEQEAKTIDGIQKGILEISNKETPFDVFICYKETDDAGRRTQDSVLANELYHQLTQEGFKVFFSRITLEDKLGQEYEPYIFAALNSAKVMVVLGTRLEYFKAVWVRNEWSRYLALIKNGASKMLIPAYKDMDPYDLPDEFSHLQAQDMSKLGFMQDLIRGIKKIIGAEQDKQAVKEPVVVQQSSGSNVTALIKRGNMALEDGEWKKADDFFEDVLNQDAECAEAYIGKLLAKEKVPDLDAYAAQYIEMYDNFTLEELSACEADEAHIAEMVAQYEIEDYLGESEIRRQYAFKRSYDSKLSSRKNQKSAALHTLHSEKLLIRARQYADGETKKKLEATLESITQKFDELINQAQDEDAEAIATVKKAYADFIGQADERVKNLHERAVNRRENVYCSGISAFNDAKRIEEYSDAKKIFLQVHRYKEAEDYIKQCDEKILQIKQKEKEEKERLEAKRKRATTRRCIALALIAVVVCTAFVVVTVIIPNNKYQKAISLMEGEDYESAMELFESLDGYKESSSYMKNCKEIIAEYNDALELMNNGDYVTAIEMFESTNGYKNSDEQIEECRNRYYNEAVALMNNGEYDGAIKVFNELDGYKDSNEQIIECNNIIANQEISKIIEAGIGSIVTFGKYGQNNNSFAEEESIEWIVLERQDDKLLVVSKYVLDFQPYGEKNADSNTWEESSLRVWMNNDFYNNAFTEAERKYISSYILDNAMSSGNEKNGEDWVFLLSVGEVKKFFTSELDRVGIITPNYDGTESNINPDTGATWWWVLPQNNEKASYVNSVGRVGNLNVYENAGVRPAMWIKLGN